MIEYQNYVDRKSDIFIYWLQSPVTKKVFYIGKTKNPEQRYRYHSRGYDDPSKNQFLRDELNKITSSGMKPLMLIIDGVAKSEWKGKERYWITKAMYDWELPLTNISLGGNSVEMTQEVRRKISEAHKGKKLSAETIHKMKGRKAWNVGIHGEHVPSILQCTQEGKVIAKFPSIRQACLALGLNRGAMSLVVRGKRKTLNGFIFRYA